mgnify:CR=1 FL=1
MITSLLIRNFKSIEDSGKLELKPLTIFVGPNASGKSNILESLAVLAQTTRLPYDAPHSLSGSLTRGEFIKYPYPGTDYVAHKTERNRSISFEIHTKPSKRTVSRILQILEEREELSKFISKKQISSVGYEHSHNPNAEEASNCILIEENKVIEITRVKTDFGHKDQVTYPQELSNFSPEESPLLMLEPRCFTIRPTSSEITKDLVLMNLAEGLSAVAKEIMADFIDNLGRVYLIKAFRGEVELPVKTGATPSWVGKKGENLVEILALCFSRREYSAKADRINEWAQKFGIDNMRAGWWGKDELGSDFEDAKLKSVLNLALASFGSKQVLSIVAQLFWSEPGDLVMIEEPEMSLHPESQVLLQDLFATTVADGKQIVCSTHSPFLILALSRVIKSGKLSRNDIAVYHVEKGDAGTKMKRLELDERGFVTGWIPSYLKVENELFDEWAESLEKA